LFPIRDGVGPEDQWSMKLAFKGLRVGLDMAVQEKGDRRAFSTCRKLVDEAYDLYLAGDKRGGFLKLDEVKKSLRKISSQ
jgi:hypothetical protein